MNFAYSTNLFRSRPLSEAIESISKAGFCTIELMADRPHAFPDDLSAARTAHLNQCLTEQKMRVCNLNSAIVTAISDIHNPSWLEEDWQHREARIRYTLDCLRLAAALGIPCVSTNAGGEIPETMNQEEAFRLFVANMHRVLPLAGKLGVKLLIEPEPGLLIETSEQMLRFLKELEFNEFLSINFDAGHFFCLGEDPCQSWEKLRCYVTHVHLDDIPANRSHRHVQLGEGDLDIPALLRSIEASDYRGHVTVRVDSYDQKPEEIVAASAEYLREKGFMSKRDEACA
ncbi:sugar phosphate isomerase/epimerase family protein [Desulfoferrobacter suflitae]|uniref:sugar phosphate isomerase/epimerase family protein n=1 Tax=Desulfoferrobacter suflitae TaxID=2865782 RepID=UPI0021645A81|nr:sugar phosphate isomerase/epimerase family protein [Desulfoferrobacter suflitae]MCK8601187.1 sugar phosphate isomerase/epimerase [Desulfoferrobacter suflitae]